VEFDQLTLRHVRLPLRESFTTSFGTVEERNLLVLEARVDGRWVYGETSPLSAPLYSHETVETAREVIAEYVAPALRQCDGIDDYHDRLASIRGHRMAKAAGDQLLYHRRSVATGESLASLLGGTHDSVTCGVSVGLTTPADVVDTVRGYLDDGFRRVKLKVEPGRDVSYVERVREAFPDVALTVDGNGAYSLDHADRLRALDNYDLTMIEQPLDYGDLVDHATLAATVETPICLDESIRNAADVRRAAEIDACEVINLKPQRVSGLREAKRIDDLCDRHDLGLWIGGLVESGIGASTAVAAASLGSVTFPADIGPSRRYFHEDLIEPPVRMTDGRIEIPETPGLLGTVDRDRLTETTVRQWSV
jgi:O-succinylbenzoate synthase